MKTKAAVDRQSVNTLPSKALSAVIAHELNNIAVPLRGFIDLGFQPQSNDELARQSLNELHIGLNRIGALAFQLESLAQQGSCILPSSLSDCFIAFDQTGLDTGLRLQWSCSQATSVAVDVGHARRAVVSLVSLSGSGSLLVDESAPDSRSCAVCGEEFASLKSWVQVEARGVRTAVLNATRAPFEDTQKLRAMQRLALAALSHCAHLAGGHVVIDLDRKSLSLLLLK